MPSRAGTPSDRERRQTTRSTLVLIAVFGSALAHAFATPALADGPRTGTRASRASTARVHTTPRVKLTAAFLPERLGAATTIRIAFRITPSPGRAPLPVTEVKLLYPAELGIGTSGLGLEACLPADLEAHGPAGCPANSLMGHGSALVEVPFGPRRVFERAPITIFSQPVQNGHIGLLFAATGDFPVIANLAFGAFVLPAHSRFGGMIDTKLPLVPSVPDGPNVALVALRTTIGPAGILYSERVGDKLVRFHPSGFLLPGKCPRGGFPFAVRLTFLDGSVAAAGTSVRCPSKLGSKPRPTS